MKYELYIYHGGNIVSLPVVDSVTLSLERKGQPGKLAFSVLNTGYAIFEEGDSCRFIVDGVTVFFGFIFEQSRQGSGDGIVKITAYDQLYYLKNKDYFQYEDKTATEVIFMLAEDFGLNVGNLADTGHRIAAKTEDNKSLFDIIQNALDDTLEATGRLYVLYDNAGKLTLSDISEMKDNTVICINTIGEYGYKTTIADDTYNKIRIFREGTEPVTVKDSGTIQQWGVLQYVEKVSSDDVNLSDRAAKLLQLYNVKKRTLTVSKAFGSVNVRAGTLLPVILSLGDVNVNNYMMVESVTHTFGDNEHFMKLRLRGGNFV